MFTIDECAQGMLGFTVFAGELPGHRQPAHWHQGPSGLSETNSSSTHHLVQNSCSLEEPPRNGNSGHVVQAGQSPPRPLQVVPGKHLCRQGFLRSTGPCYSYTPLLPLERDRTPKHPSFSSLWLCSFNQHLSLSPLSTLIMPDIHILLWEFRGFYGQCRCDGVMFVFLSPIHFN
jgi:hypothetical protein